MKLTKTDKFIMDSYSSMIEGLSAYLGSAYEISLHSLEDYNHSVVKNHERISLRPFSRSAVDGPSSEHAQTDYRSGTLRHRVLYCL